MPANYTLENLDLTSDAITYVFTEGGTIDKILVANAINAYDIFFSINGSILTSDSFTEVVEGTEITFSGNLIFAAGETFSIFVGSASQPDVTITVFLV
jgi:hypothetical protein